MQIKVCGLPFDVNFVEGGHAVSHNKERIHLYGEVSYENESIRIDNTKSLQMMNQTFWHEVMHVIVERMSIRELMTQDNCHLEVPIDQIALGIFTVLNSIDKDVIVYKEEA
jgi:predicted metal-dependent peptidase